MSRGWCALLLVACSSTAAINPVDAGVIEDVQNVPDVRPRDSGTPPPPHSGIEVTGPALLSQTGMYADFENRAIAPGLVEFAPRWPAWSDGAYQRRWIQLPPGRTVDTSDMNQWTFPEETKFWRSVEVDGKPVEVQFLWKRGSGWRKWWMASYVWREDASDADYVEQGAVNVLGTTHNAPSQTECVQCHVGIIDVGVGFSAIQLSAAQNSQLALYSSKGMLSKPATQEYDAPGTGTVKAALVALHANCGHCHVETSRLYQQQAQIDFRLRTTDVTLQDTGAYKAIGSKAKHMDEWYGVINIVPARPGLSQAWLRMNVRDKGEWQMPPIATKQIDVESVSVVGQWILSLPPGADQ